MNYVQKVREETVGAFVNGNLMFKASHPVSRKDAYDIMCEAVPNGYNDFDANVILELPEDAEVTLAREYSVCLYVRKVRLSDLEDVNAQEIDQEEDGSIRLWWD